MSNQENSFGVFIIPTESFTAPRKWHALEEIMRWIVTLFSCR